MDENKIRKTRNGADLGVAERHKFIQEYLAGGYTKQEIWYKYTGKPEEHGAILKWMRMYEVNTLHVAKQLLDRVIEVYNNERPHMSLGNLTPNQVHQYAIDNQNLWKK